MIEENTCSVRTAYVVQFILNLPHVANGYLNAANGFASKHLKIWMNWAKQQENSSNGKDVKLAVKFEILGHI